MTVAGATFVTWRSAKLVTPVVTGGLTTGGPFVGPAPATFVTLPLTGACAGRLTVNVTLVI